MAKEKQTAGASAGRERADDGRWADRGVVPRTDGRTGWVVVADEAIARLLATDPDAPGELQPLHALTDPTAHAREGELHVNDAGRRSGSVSREGGRPGGPAAGGSASLVASAGEDETHQSAQAFARRVAAELAAAARDRRYDELTLIAAPRFLGLLRQALDANVRALVVAELDKDVIHESDAEVAARVRKLARG